MRSWTTSTPSTSTSGTGRRSLPGRSAIRTFLKRTVRAIVGAMLDTRDRPARSLPPALRAAAASRTLTFVTAQELEDLYPGLAPEERETRLCEGAHDACPSCSIGGPLRSGKPHDGRAPDYYDWDLNGDLLLLGRSILDLAQSFLHGHPRGRRRALGAPADPRPLRRTAGTLALPDKMLLNCAAAPDHGRRYRPDPAVHAAAGQAPTSAKYSPAYGTAKLWTPAQRPGSRCCNLHTDKRRGRHDRVFFV